MSNKTISLLSIIKTMDAKGYKIFDDPYDLNLFGVRSSNPRAGKFDDTIGAFYSNGSGGVNFHAWPGTTDPGVYWLENLGNVQGTFILMPGQWRGMFTLGKHRGKYTALVQAKPVQGWRDSNRDKILDMDPDGKTYEGIFGINLHRASAAQIKEDVGMYSAGCQVVQDAKHFNVLMALCELQASMIANVFTYTLIEEDDLMEV